MLRLDQVIGSSKRKKKAEKGLTLEMHSLALYSRISDIRLMAIENGIIVCSLLEDWPWFPEEPVHREQNTVSQVSQNNSS